MNLKINRMGKYGIVFLVLVMVQISCSDREVQQQDRDSLEQRSMEQKDTNSIENLPRNNAENDLLTLREYLKRSQYGKSSYDSTKRGILRVEDLDSVVNSGHAPYYMKK